MELDQRGGVVRDGLRRVGEEPEQRTEGVRARAVLQELEHEHIESLDELRPLLHLGHVRIEKPLQKHGDGRAFVLLPDGRRERGLLEHLHHGVEDVLARAGRGRARRGDGGVKNRGHAVGEEAHESVGIRRHGAEHLAVADGRHDLVAQRFHTLHGHRVADARDGVERSGPASQTNLHRRRFLPLRGLLLLLPLLLRRGLRRGARRRVLPPTGEHRRHRGDHGLHRSEHRRRHRRNRGAARLLDAPGPPPREALVPPLHLPRGFRELFLQRVPKRIAQPAQVPPRVVAANLVRRDQTRERRAPHADVPGLVRELGNLRQSPVTRTLHDVQAVSLHQGSHDVENLEAGLGVLRVEAAHEVARDFRRGENPGDESNDSPEFFPHGFHGVPALVHERGEEERALLLAQPRAAVLDDRERVRGEVQNLQQRLRVRRLLAQAENYPSQEQIQGPLHRVRALAERSLEVLHSLDVRPEVFPEEERVNIRADVARGRRLEVVLRVFNFVVAHTLKFDGFPGQLPQPRLLLSAVRDEHGSGCHRPGGDGGQARRGRSNASDAGRAEAAPRRRSSSRRRSRAVTLRPHRRRGRRRVERAGRGRRRVERVLLHVRGYRGFERGWEARRGEEARGAGGADAANHLVNHPAARGSRGCVLIPQARSRRGDRAHEVVLGHRGVVPGHRGQDPGERIGFAVAAHLPREFDHLVRDVRESLAQPRRRAPRLQRASRGGADGRLTVTELFDNLGDETVAVTPLADGCAHRGRDGANRGERIRREVAVRVGESLGQRGHEVAGVGPDALRRLVEDFVHGVQRGGANLPAGIAHLLDQFFGDFSGDVGAGQAAVGRRRDGRPFRPIRSYLPRTDHRGADVRVTRELSLQRLELRVLEVG